MIFFIDIPFKSSQRISNFEAHWSAVSYLVSGVVFGQGCNGQRPPLVSGIIGTAFTGHDAMIVLLQFVTCLGLEWQACLDGICYNLMFSLSVMP
jgi:hypothetical protein